jgi:hypothetical protein
LVGERVGFNPEEEDEPCFVKGRKDAMTGQDKNKK